jgi:hypothetical protein
MVSKTFADAVKLSSYFYKSSAEPNKAGLKSLSILTLSLWHGVCLSCAPEARIWRMCKAPPNKRDGDEGVTSDM